MAEYIFSVDVDARVCVKVKEDLKKYSKAVENQISYLKHKYCEFTHELRRIGMGLTVEEIQKDSNLSNVQDKLLIGFPVWECLHGFWHTLPSFNPHVVSSEPGQDLEGDTIGVLFGNKDEADGSAGLGVGDTDEPDGLWEMDNMLLAEEEEHAGGEANKLEDSTLGATENDPVQLVHTISSLASQSLKSGPVTTRKVSGKHSHIKNSLEASATKNAKLLELAKGSYNFKTANITTKHQKMMLRAEQECESQWYAAEERALMIKERMQDKEFKHWEWVLLSGQH
ncbi:hypothetical protein EDB87DRAFT_1696414 [Lactarius vividus]|nr:hypothetical protein EDB87DRAFT_1696414 [Lactarius vividus]